LQLPLLSLQLLGPLPLAVEGHLGAQRRVPLPVAQRLDGGLEHIGLLLQRLELSLELGLLLVDGEGAGLGDGVRSEDQKGQHQRSAQPADSACRHDRPRFRRTAAHGRIWIALIASVALKFSPLSRWAACCRTGMLSRVPTSLRMRQTWTLTVRLPLPR